MVLQSFPARISGRSLTLALAAAALSACSPSGDAATEDVPLSKDPPGAALPLSIGGRVDAEGEGVYQTSINCAAALNITGERLMQMSSAPNSAEIRLIARAEQHFKARATKAQQEDPEITGTPGAAIARLRSEKAGEASQQAQLAIACLRRFGEEA